MGDAEVITSSWREVELGRVVLMNSGAYKGKLAAIVEIIDHKRVRQRIHLLNEKDSVPQAERFPVIAKFRTLLCIQAL